MEKEQKILGEKIFNGRAIAIFHWTPTVLYLNISRTTENRAKGICITGITDLVYCLIDPKQFFFYFSEKCTTAALRRVVL